MPIDASATIEITAFEWVPEFARGLVRDLRVRWALEELGLPYRVRLLDATHDRPEAYLQEQPFGQVPVFVDGDMRLFESGAILLHLGERGTALMPADPVGRARATCWLIAALNSIEPTIFDLIAVDVFNAGKDWAKQRRPDVLKAVRNRLDRLADWLGDNPHLEGEFTVADLMMTTVLRSLRHTDLVAERPKLAAYQARCEARPAFQRALAAQLADFKDRPAA